jgi:hypothetical protein
MDELQMISTMLAKPDPSEDVVERGRRQLQAGGSSGPARRRPVGWVTGGLGLTAAAAAAAVLVVSQTSAPTPTTHSPPAGAARQPGRPAPAGTRTLSGQQVLLAAATTAQGRPDQIGTYWHVRDQFVQVDGEAPDVMDRWTRRDGAAWYRSSGDPRHLVVREYGPTGFHLAHDELTLTQLGRLPTNPAALTRWIRDSFTRPAHLPPAAATPGGHVPADGMIEPLPAELVPSETAIALATLLYEVPAPAAVRAAAFRALAAMPIVRNLGPVAGGQALRIALPPPPPGKYTGQLPRGVDRIDLVIDPVTTMIRSITNYQGTSRMLAAEWVNHLPR